MLDFDAVFNPSTINIFTDASVKGKDTCPGCIVVQTLPSGDRIVVNASQYVIQQATNNMGEISAIELGIMEALKYNNRFRVNLFSDSKICIVGLREWIFNWCNTMTDDGVIYSSTGSAVANQEVIFRIINTIIGNNLKINLYHQKGHVPVDNHVKVEKAMKTFNDSNRTNVTDLNLIRQLSYYNGIVDNTTRLYLNNASLSYSRDLDSSIIYERKVDLNRYKALVGS